MDDPDCEIENATRQMYVEYLPTCFFKERPQPVSNRKSANVPIPQDACGFRFFDILTGVVNWRGERVAFKSERFNESPIHYFGKCILTLQELEEKLPHAVVLIQEMRKRGRKRAVQTRRNIHALKESDLVVLI